MQASMFMSGILLDLIFPTPNTVPRVQQILNEHLWDDRGERE